MPSFLGSETSFLGEDFFLGETDSFVPEFGVPTSTIRVTSSSYHTLVLAAHPSTIRINSQIVSAESELELSANFVIEVLSSTEILENLGFADAEIEILSSPVSPDFVDNVFSQDSTVEIRSESVAPVSAENVYAQDSTISLLAQSDFAISLPIGVSTIRIVADPSVPQLGIRSDVLFFVAGGTPIDESGGLSLYIKGIAPGSTEEFGGIDFFIDSEPQTDHINFVLSASAVSEGPQTDYVNFFLNTQDAFQDSASQSFILYNIREQDSASIGLFVEGEGTTPDSVPEDGYLNIILMNNGDSGSFDIFVKAPDGDTASIGFRINAVEGIESEEITVYVFGVGTENQNLPIFVRGFID